MHLRRPVTIALLAPVVAAGAAVAVSFAAPARPAAPQVAAVAPAAMLAPATTHTEITRPGGFGSHGPKPVPPKRHTVYSNGSGHSS